MLTSSGFSIRSGQDSKSESDSAKGAAAAGAAASAAAFPPAVFGRQTVTDTVQQIKKENKVTSEQSQ